MGGHDGGGAGRRCELCGAPAAVHCAADAAFLCAACDAKVHGANFLASRHLRTPLVARAEAVGRGASEGDGYESAASSCVSTADSAPAAARRGRAPAVPGRPRRGEAVLEGWARRMGLAPGAARRRAAAAGRALRACGPEVAAARVPLRVAMAAALWREVAGGGGGAGHGQDDALRRLEACAHVPARRVLEVAASLPRARARRRAAVEGWGECAWAGPKSRPARS